MKDFDYEFDFGFTAVTEEEVKNSVDVYSDVVLWKARAEKERQDKEKMFSMIMPLLNNLRRNPESEYIHWKDRDVKIKEFGEKLTDIVLGAESWDEVDSYFTGKKK
jgi:hypothetical protein